MDVVIIDLFKDMSFEYSKPVLVEKLKNKLITQSYLEACNIKWHKDTVCILFLNFLHPPVHRGSYMSARFIEFIERVEKNDKM